MEIQNCKKLFNSDIQDGGHLEILQTTSPPKPYVRLSRNLMGGIGVAERFKIAKIVPFRYPRWLPWRPFWNSLNYISSQTVSWIEQKLDGRYRSDIEIQNCQNSSIPISKMAAMAAILKVFKDWPETWWDASKRQRESELLKSFHFDVQDGRYGRHLEILQTTYPLNCNSDWAETWWEHQCYIEIQSC